MTAARRILSWTALLASALALRLGLALGTPNVFFPDEIFQTLEPAHRLAFGYGVVSWEWRLGIRSWVFPALLAGIMRLSAWIAPGSAGYLLAIQIVLALLSLTTVWFGYAWAKRASGTPAAIIAALGCSFYFGLVYFAPKALTEVVAAHILLPGLYLGHYAEKPGERGRMFGAGLLCALAACLRVQLLPALLFATIYFCVPRWRQRVPSLAAGAALPVLLFGAADWISWASPWHSFIGVFMANLVHGTGKDLSLHQPWYWFLLVLPILLGPALLLLVHGARRSPFLAIFSAIVVVAHSLIPHKELRYIYPILAPAVVLAAIGFVELTAELCRGKGLFSRPRWIVASGAAVLFASSALLALLCTGWCATRWGAAAFDRIGSQPSLCGVGLHGVMYWESGGYAHLHREVPIVPTDSPASLRQDAPLFNALIAPQQSSDIPPAFTPAQCWSRICVWQRPGGCQAPRPDQELNEYLKKAGL